MAHSVVSLRPGVGRFWVEAGHRDGFYEYTANEHDPPVALASTAFKRAAFSIVPLVSSRSSSSLSSTSGGLFQCGKPIPFLKPLLDIGWGDLSGGLDACFQRLRLLPLPWIGLTLSIGGVPGAFRWAGRVVADCLRAACCLIFQRSLRARIL